MMNNINKFKNAMNNLHFNNEKSKVFSYIYKNTSNKIPKIFPRTIVSLAGIQFVLCFISTSSVSCMIR